MPSVYLSPSTQEFNQFVNGGTEEEYANLIVDYMIPYLRASGITYTRNTPDMTAASSIRQSKSAEQSHSIIPAVQKDSVLQKLLQTILK